MEFVSINSWVFSIFIKFDISFGKTNIFFRLQIAPPTYGESEYRANIVDKNDSQHTRLAGGQDQFAPRYPVYTGQSLPTLPDKQN